MGKDNEVFIVAISAQKANVKQMIEAVFGQTGDAVPFFCLTVVEGKPYDGHAHTFLQPSVTDPDDTPIEL